MGGRCDAEVTVIPTLKPFFEVPSRESERAPSFSRLQRCDDPLTYLLDSHTPRLQPPAPTFGCACIEELMSIQMSCSVWSWELLEERSLMQGGWLGVNSISLGGTVESCPYFKEWVSISRWVHSVPYGISDSPYMLQSVSKDVIFSSRNSGSRLVGRLRSILKLVRNCLMHGSQQTFGALVPGHQSQRAVMRHHVRIH